MAKKNSIAIFWASGKNTILQFFGFYVFSHWSLSHLSSQITLSHEENTFYIVSGGNLVYCFIICRPLKERLFAVSLKIAKTNPDVKHTKENYSCSAKKQIKQKFTVIDFYSNKKPFTFSSSRKACRLSSLIYSWIFLFEFLYHDFLFNQKLHDLNFSHDYWLCYNMLIVIKTIWQWWSLQVSLRQWRTEREAEIHGSVNRFTRYSEAEQRPENRPFCHSAARLP